MAVVLLRQFGSPPLECEAVVELSGSQPLAGRCYPAAPSHPPVAVVGRAKVILPTQRPARVCEPRFDCEVVRRTDFRTLRASAPFLHSPSYRSAPLEAERYL